MSDHKTMSVKEFRELGYLQEVNRRQLHPLGLALEVIVEEDGTERFGMVWDYRDDPEGIHYGPGMIDQNKAIRIHEEFADRHQARMAKLGYYIQPLSA